MKHSQTKKLKPKSIKEISTDSLMKSLIMRHKQNPHKYYVPNGKCEDFIRMVGSGKHFVNLFVAGNGVGKTCLAVNTLAHIVFGKSGNKYFDYPLFNKFPYPRRGRIISDPTTIQSTFIPELKKWLPPGRYKTNKKSKNYEYSWVTDTGFSWDILSYEQDPKEFESATLGFAIFDEPPPYSIFKATVARMRLGGIIIVVFTPLIGSAYFYDEIVTHPDTKVY